MDRDTFLHRLKLWEIRALIRGHNDMLMMQHRTTWEASRWQTCLILRALGAKSISQPSDLVVFPWEKRPDEELTDEQVEELRRQLQEENERNK